MLLVVTGMVHTHLVHTFSMHRSCYCASKNSAKKVTAYSFFEVWGKGLSCAFTGTLYTQKEAICYFLGQGKLPYFLIHHFVVETKINYLPFNFPEN